VRLNFAFSYELFYTRIAAMKLPKGYIFCELTFGSDQFRWQLLSFADTEAAFEALVCQIASG